MLKFNYFGYNTFAHSTDTFSYQELHAFMNFTKVLLRAKKT